MATATEPGLLNNRSGQVVGASVALIVLPTVTVALRLLSRWISRAGYWVSNSLRMKVVKKVNDE